MSFSLSTVPLFDELKAVQAKTVLLGKFSHLITIFRFIMLVLAGCGGGYDIYSGLPLYFALKELGYTVHLWSLCFTSEQKVILSLSFLQQFIW